MAESNGLRSRSTNKSEEEEGLANEHDHDKMIPCRDMVNLESAAAVSLAKTATVTVLSPAIMMTLVLIFGGCCSNVFVLESILKTSPATGTLVTFLQFLLISIHSLRSQLTSKAPAQSTKERSSPRIIPHLRPRLIPLYKWLIYTTLFLTINVLNNTAFKYRISVPLHIILRSAGPVTSMLVGRFVAGRKYTSRQVTAVILLFSGVALAASSDAQSKFRTRSDLSVESRHANAQSTAMTHASFFEHMPIDQAPGFILLFLALLLSAFMGLYSDQLYDTYGRSAEATNESLFYSHALSLPFFALQFRTLQAEYDALTTNSSVGSLSKSASYLTSLLSTLPPQIILAYIPTPIQHMLSRIQVESWTPSLLLLANAITQIICITGVSRLSTQTTSLTVSVILNIRKLVSLLLSIWLFGNQLPFGVGAGALLVFVGGGLYGWKSKPKSERIPGKVTQDKKSR